MFTNYKRIAVCLSSGKFAFWWGCFASVPNECYVYRYKGKKRAARQKIRRAALFQVLLQIFAYSYSSVYSFFASANKESAVE